MGGRGWLLFGVNLQLGVSGRITMSLIDQSELPLTEKFT